MVRKTSKRLAETRRKFASKKNAPKKVPRGNRKLATKSVPIDATLQDIESDEFLAALERAFSIATESAVRAHLAAGQKVFASVNGVGKVIDSVSQLDRRKRI